MNYGIGYETPCSYAEIGRNLGVCRERVRQRAQRAQRKLKLILQPSLAA
jgi:DNA-directed RNA polymerase sigma subunit (sigma70/sigma32)